MLDLVETGDQRSIIVEGEYYYLRILFDEYTWRNHARVILGGEIFECLWNTCRGTWEILIFKDESRAGEDNGDWIG